MKLRIKRIVDFGKVPSGIGIAALGITVILSISGIGYYEEAGRILKSTEISNETDLSKAIMCARIFDVSTPEEAIYLYMRAMRYGNPLYLMAVMPESSKDEYEEWMVQTYQKGGFVTGKGMSIYSGEGWIDYPQKEPNPWFPEDGYAMHSFTVHNLMIKEAKTGTAVVQVWLPDTKEYLLWELKLTREEGWKAEKLWEQKTSAEGFAWREPLLCAEMTSGNWKITLEGRNEAHFADRFSGNITFFPENDPYVDTEEYPKAFDMSYKCYRAYVTWLGEEPLDGHRIKVVIKTKEENVNSGEISISGEDLLPESCFTVFDNGSGYAYWQEGEQLPEFTAWIYMDGECVEIIGGDEA